ncbi:MAG TPA: TIR domain-containing protein [Bacteroidia bacterium]|nr:TIR domain-containing protein [Bacteroidia bacterium]
MRNIITILISHDKGDEKIAFELKVFLEDVFQNVLVFVSGRDLIGGQTWIEQIKNRLKTSEVIISLLTSKSLNNNWVYFESGAGFVEDKTIPLLTDNLKLESLIPPMSLLQARLLSERGVVMLIKDIAQKLNLPREPKHYPSIKELISRIEKNLRQESTLKLKSVISIKEIAPSAKKQWTFEGNCLVHDFIIKKHEITVDTYFYLDKTEIQLFDRSGSKEFVINTMCKTDKFLPKPLDQFEVRNNRLIFQTFNSNEKTENIASSLTDLLVRIEGYSMTDKD